MADAAVLNATSDTSLLSTLGGILRHPVRNLLTGWNWKAGLISAMIRAGIFFATNLKSGHHRALNALLTEAVFAIFAAGVMAALTQRLRHATPVWATRLFVWLAMPTMMVAAQATVHRLSGTEHMRSGLIASFCFAAFASGFNWYAQRQGVMVAGREGTSFGRDLAALPRIIGGFLMAGPKALVNSDRERTGQTAG